jgi:hypothetical protein
LKVVCFLLQVDNIDFIKNKQQAKVEKERGLGLNFIFGIKPGENL